MLLTDVQTVLCLGAHADDIELGCGGTLLRLLAENAGLRIHFVVLSAPNERASEAESSARTFLGAADKVDVSVADFKEMYFPYLGEGFKNYFVRLGSTVTPDLIFTHWREDLHQDHRTVSELTWQTFRDHLILEYEIPKWDGDMGRPNVFVPLDRDTCERKVEHLLKAFPSQAGRDWFDPEVFWGLLRLRGMEAHSPHKYAEAFHCRKLGLR